VKVVKNKVAPPFRIAEFDVLFGHGISTLGCILDMAEETGVITRKGAWYSYDGDNLGQGRDNTIVYLQEHPDFAEEVDRLVREKLALGAVVSANSVAKESRSTVEDGE
jgi:recombination protein RecA